MPVYTEIDEGGLISWLDGSPERTARLRLPLTHWPHPSWHPAADTQWILPPPTPSPDSDTANPNTTTTTNSSTISLPANSSPSLTPHYNPPPTPTPLTKETPDSDSENDLYTLQSRIITSLFSAIASKNTEIVTLLITQGFVSPDVTDQHGTTPLIAAILAGNGAMVCSLVGLGATVNSYGVDPKANGMGRDGGRERTPLMVAAGLGRLALVKLLVEDFGADDAVIAPDGQLALRLAADNGHREVVEYLPVRRGGEWRRWKVHHHVMVRRVTKALWNIERFARFFVWDLPRFLVWSVPKHVVVKPLVKAGRYCWEERGRFKGWVGRQAREMPGRVKRGGEKVWRGVKKVPEGCWRVVKGVPRVVRAVMEAVWKVVRRIPAAMKAVAAWVWESLKRVGKAVGGVFLKVVSAIHTAVMAVLEFFRKTTLRDVWNGVCDVFEAVFVTLPKAIWTGIKASGEVAYKVLFGMFGVIGALIWYFFKGLLWVAKFVPQQLWKIICSIGSSMAKGYHEMMVWFNPKH